MCEKQYTGTVKFFVADAEIQWGIITVDDIGIDIYVNILVCHQMVLSLHTHQRVRFIIVESDKGKMADKVEILL